MALAGKNLELAMRIRADLQQAIGELKQLEGGVGSVGRTSATTERQVAALGRTLGTVVAAFAGGMVFKAVLNASVEQERVTAQLEQTLRATGSAAGYTRDELLNMASGLQKVTTYGDEAIIPAQSILLTFKELGKEVFPQALEMALDLSTFLGQDLKSSATQLGKALQDPINGINALSRAGASFSQQQKDTIKQLVDAGRVADAQRLILAELEGQYGGTARRARDTLGGALAAVKNAFGDLLEAPGGMKDAQASLEALTRLLEDPNTVAAANTLTSTLVDGFGKAVKAITEAVHFTRWLGEELAAITNGPSIGDSPRLQMALEARMRAEQSLLSTPDNLVAETTLPGRAFSLAQNLYYRFTNEEALPELQRKLKATEELAESTGKALDEVPKGVGKGLDLAGLSQANEQYDKLLANLRKQSETFGQVGEAAKVRYAIESGELGKLDADQQQALLRYAQEIDAKRASTEASRKASDATAQQTRQQQEYVRGLERSAALIGLSTDQVRAYELAEKGLTGALRDRAIAAQALIAAEERKQQLDADARQIAGLRAQLLRAEGRDAEALTIEIEQRYGELMTRLRERGDTAGLAIIDGLVNVEQAQIRFNEIQRRYDQVLAEQTRQEQSVQAEQQAGLLSEVGARERILEIHRQTSAQLQEIRPLLAEMAQMPGAIGASAQQALDNLDAQANRLRATTSLLQETLRTGIEGGLTSALSGLATGTMNLREAVTALGQSVADALAQMAARNIAEGLTNSVMGLFGGGGQQGAELATGAAAVTTSAGALSAAGATLVTGAAAIQAAAASLAAASAGSAGAGAGAGGLGLLSMFGGAGGAAGAGAYTGAFGFAEGGHVLGPGTTTSDSIPTWLSNYEFVTRAAVVQQPGMLDLLNDINARGWAAINDLTWQRAARHNTGGLAGVPAPALAAPSLGNTRLAEPAKAMSTNLKNNVNLYAVQRPEDVAGMAWGKAGQEHFMVYLQQNGAEVRQLLGL
ncbi:TPA: phage tail length tape measure family protein [Pseudomonas aeruginosa]|nr:phage tail length tape measure family protein [Pseudomonas aeruginosa]HEJ2039567.1 phage tail length tape measure family protein [Pseudomonas aeruginosa]